METDMTAETPIEMFQLPEQLRNLFTGKLPEATSGTREERERNFLSRALAAYAIFKLGGAELDVAAAAVVDGGGDGGIDAIFHSAAANTLWIAQSKFISTGRGEPELGGVTKFKTGLENLLQGNFDAFRSNTHWNRLLPRIQSIFDRGGLQVRAILVYTGINLISEDRKWLFEDLKRRFSAEADYFDILICNLTTVHDWLIGIDQSSGIPKAELRLLKPGWIREPYETLFGIIPLKEIAELYALHGKRLIAANIRRYKGRTEVNDQIFEAVKEEPQHFFYLNNGLTAFCERLEVHNLDRANPDSKRITVYGLSIVNGAQTLGSLAKYFTACPQTAAPGFAFLKIISLERCFDDREFAARITRSTNLQNQIGSRDFVALDEQQEMIANQLMLTGVAYHYKTDVERPTPDETNFSLEEATTACACLDQQGDCDFCARVLANRQSLWAMDEIYPPEELMRSRYSRVFRPDRSARTVWRAVQTQRLVIATMQNSARTSAGIRKAFFENARWLVLNLVFLKLRSESGEQLTLPQAEEGEITRKTIEIAETLWNACEALSFISRRTDSHPGYDTYEQPRHFRSIFSAAADCRLLRNRTLSLLAQAG
jgi:hypothetical protein